MYVETGCPEAADLHDAFWRSLGRLCPNMSSSDVEYATNISLANKYIFVETPKCACTTVKLTLQRIELKDPTFFRDDFEQVHVREFSPLLTPLQIGDFANLVKDPRFLKFCFVRHPYTRMVSAYLDKIARGTQYKAIILRQLGKPATEFVSFEEFVGAVYDQSFEDMDCHWRPQYFLTLQELISYDMIGRFENFEQDFKTIGSRLVADFPLYYLPEQRHATNATQRLAEYLSDRVKYMIQSKFAIDFEYFGYSH